MNRGNIRYTGIATFATGSGAQSGEVEMPRHFSDPRPSGISIGGEGGATVRRLFLSSASTDYLACYASLSTGGLDFNGGLLYVAKPPALRPSNFGGRILSGWSYAALSDTRRSRTWVGGASGTLVNGAKINEVIEPEFETIPGAVHGTNYGERYVIFAATPTEPLDVIGGNGSACPLIDINVDARHFIAEPNVVQVCVNGLIKNMLILAGDPF